MISDDVCSHGTMVAWSNTMQDTKLKDLLTDNIQYPTAPKYCFSASYRHEILVLLIFTDNIILTIY